MWHVEVGYLLLYIFGWNEKQTKNPIDLHWKMDCVIVSFDLTNKTIQSILWTAYQGISSSSHKIECEIKVSK